MTTSPAAWDVLIVGCGRIAGGFDMADGVATPPQHPLTHAGAYMRHGGFRLQACVEPDANRRAAFMAHWKIPLGYESVADAASTGLRVDVVSLCSPTEAHATDFQAALALGPRAIFCEKPVTPSVAATEALVDCCTRAGVLLAINHTRRWAPDVVRLRTELSQGRWGALRSMTGRYNKGLLNNGSHLLDLMNYLAGPLEALAAGTPHHDFWPNDPSVSALLRTVSGIPVTLNVGDARDYTCFELDLVTSEGLIAMENGGLSWRVRTRIESPHFAGYQVLSPATEQDGQYREAMLAAVSNIASALCTNAPLASTGQSALQAQRLCELILSLANARSTSP